MSRTHTLCRQTSALNGMANLAGFKVVAPRVLLPTNRVTLFVKQYLVMS